MTDGALRLDDVLKRYVSLPTEAKTAARTAAVEATSSYLWIPQAGPQTDAYFSKADVLLYGGQGGGGKSDLGLGLAFTAHQRSLVLRRQYSNLSALTTRAIQINGSRQGYNGGPPPKLTTADGRYIEFGANQHLGDEQNWQGQPFDLKVFDEACHFLELQVRFHLGWLRTVIEGQRCRALLATNPPVANEGDWVIGMFRPWLDLTHHKPAKHGELRWYVTDPDGKDMEVDGPETLEMGGKRLIPQSRTFIPAALSDNLYLARTDYQAKLDALPEPYRSAVRDGNFMAGRKDDERQLIPTAWVREAQARWTDKPPQGIPMCALGVDVTGGGEDQNVIAPRYDGYFPALTVIPGAMTPAGSSLAGQIVGIRRNGARVIVDMGGGYGGTTYSHLKANEIDVVAYKGAEASVARTADGKLGFYNKRSEAWWKFREALDPGQERGSPIQLPDDPELVADLVAPHFEVGPRGIKIEAKENVVERLGRSPDRGDAVVMAWWSGPKAITHAKQWSKGQGHYQKMPNVVVGRLAGKKHRSQ